MLVESARQQRRTRAYDWLLVQGAEVQNIASGSSQLTSNDSKKT